MANYDVALFVGHGTSEVDGSYDPGATSNGKQEHLIAEKIIDLAVIKCKAKGINVHRDEQNYKDNDLAGNTYNYKYAVELHLNGGGGTRAELYTPCKEKDLTIEFYMLEELAKLGLKNGGVRSRDYNSEKTFMRSLNDGGLNYTDYYGSINRAWKQGISLDILEVGFIDSSDVIIVENNIDKIAIIIANAMCKLCGKSLITNNNEKVEFDMNKIVCYFGDADLFGAIIVAQKNQCPLMRLSDYKASGLKAKEVIQIGGKHTDTNRYVTFKNAAALV